MVRESKYSQTEITIRGIFKMEFIMGRRKRTPNGGLFSQISQLEILISLIIKQISSFLIILGRIMLIKEEGRNRKMRKIMFTNGRMEHSILAVFPGENAMDLA